MLAHLSGMAHMHGSEMLQLLVVAGIIGWSLLAAGYIRRRK